MPNTASRPDRVPPRHRPLRPWRPCALLTALTLATTATLAQAQLYKWVDENGRVQYSDSVPPTATDRARKELRTDGTVKGSVERALTPEEKRAAALRAAEEAKAQEAQREQERKDRALMATYPTLLDHDRARGRALATLDTDIAALAEREALLTKATQGVALTAPEQARLLATSKAEGDAKAAPGKPAASAKLGSGQTLDAKAELPRVSELLSRKRRERADLAASNAAERTRLAALLEAEAARLAAAKAPPAATPAKPLPDPKGGKR